MALLAHTRSTGVPNTWPKSGGGEADMEPRGGALSGPFVVDP